MSYKVGQKYTFPLNSGGVVNATVVGIPGMGQSTNWVRIKRDGIKEDKKLIKIIKGKSQGVAPGWAFE